MSSPQFARPGGFSVNDTSKANYQPSPSAIQEQADLDDLKARMATNDTLVSGHTAALALKANQADLVATNANVSANALSLAEKMQQSDFANYINAKMLSEQMIRTKYFLFDSFYRADSTTSLGNAETNNLPYTLLSTASPSATWGISGNQGYCLSSATAGRSLAYQESNESDCIVECDVVIPASGGGGFSFRITDVNNFFFVTISNNSLLLSKYVAGTATNLATVNKTLSSGRLTVVLKGNRITVYLDGFFITQFYDSFNNTATKHGLYSRADSPNFMFSNFAVKPVGVGIIPNRVLEDFETGLTKWYWTKETPAQSYSQTFNTSIKKSGSQSLRLELHSTDPDVDSSKRNEIYLPAERPLEEYWYGVSIYLPNGGTEDFAYDTSAEALIQWHATPDSGEQNVSPPLALLTQNGHYWISKHWDANRMSSQSSPLTLSTSTIDLGDYTADKGTWVDWIFHVRWGYQAIHEPITEVYKNGLLVFQDNGTPNCYNDQTGVYPKVGIYKWDWHYGNPSLTTSRVVYYDNYFKK